MSKTNSEYALTRLEMAISTVKAWPDDQNWAKLDVALGELQQARDELRKEQGRALADRIKAECDPATLDYGKYPKTSWGDDERQRDIASARLWLGRVRGWLQSGMPLHEVQTIMDDWHGKDPGRHAFKKWLTKWIEQEQPK